MKLKLLFASLITSGLSIAQIPTFEWANSMGGAASDNSRSIEIDASGNVYTVGTFNGTVDLDPGAGTSTHTSAGANDIFVTKFTSTGAFVWALSFGSDGVDFGTGIAVDASGNIYICGGHENTIDLDPGAGTFNHTSTGFYDLFVMKLDNSGAFIWGMGTGSTGDDLADDIVLGSSTEVYVTGYFNGTVDFDPGVSTDNLTPAGSTDIFLLKLDAFGAYGWTKQIGGTNSDNPEAMTIDPMNNIYLTGIFGGTVDFDPGPGTTTLTGTGDVFVCKLYGSGSFAWAKSFGGTGNDYGYGIATDLNGNVYTTGRFDATVDFDPGAGSFPLTSGGSRDVFINKLDSTGTFVWAVKFGITNIDIGYDIETDATGNVYATGTWGNTVDFDPGAGTYTMTPFGGTESYIVKLTDAGAFVWAIQFAGPSADQIYDIELDAAGNLYACGYYSSTGDFDPGPGTYPMTVAGAGFGDAFVLKLNPPVSTGIDQNDPAEQVIVYPNPSNGYFSILHNAEISNIRIMNVLGELVFSSENHNVSHTNIDLSKQANGIYFYQLEREGKIISTGKIIKK